MSSYYFTLGHGQPNFPGFIEVIGDNYNDAREVVTKLTKNRFAFSYDSVKKIHPLDLRRVCLISVVGDTAPLPKLIEAHPSAKVELFCGYEYLL